MRIALKRRRRYKRKALSLRGVSEWLAYGVSSFGYCLLLLGLIFLVWAQWDYGVALVLFGAGTIMVGLLTQSVTLLFAERMIAALDIERLLQLMAQDDPTSESR